MKTILSLGLLLTALFIINTPLYAQIEVTNLDDSGTGSLREAIDEANSTSGADEITFDESLDGTILLSTGQMSITDDLTITGPGADVITIDADGTSRIFEIDDSTGTEISVSISGLTFINGSVSSDDGGAILNNEDLIINSCDFEDNSADNGGAIYNTVTITSITNSSFFGNNSSEDGGAVYNEGTVTEIKNSTLGGNSTSEEGGAIYIDTDATISVISNTTFSGNITIWDGGAISNAGTLSEISNCTFDGNIADTGGAIDNGSTITEITNCTFTGNTAPSSGGALCNEGSISKITNSTFIDNTGSFGGAIATSDPVMMLRTSNRFSVDNVITVGATILTDGSIAEISNSTFTSNKAEAGGAIASSNATLSEITNSTFSNNVAGDTGGGAIFNIYGTLAAITNSTFTGNSTDTDGGAIYNDDDGIISISFTTIANNEADDEGGGIYNAGTSIDIRNSIATFNTATTSGNNCNEDIATSTDESNNYSNDTTCGFDGDDSTIILDQLADNGGPTQTLALQGGDPLDGASSDCDTINDLGIAVTIDQRNFPRPFGSFCDSGAYENGPSASVTIKKVTDPPGGTGFDFTTTGFEELEGCGLEGDSGELVMDHTDSQSCAVPFGDYTVTEDISEGQELNIFCTDITPINSIDNDTGVLSFSIASSQFNVNCLFINVTAQTLLNAVEELPGTNCDAGGVKVETGLDTNLNGELDSDEVLNSFFVCNGEQGAVGPQGPQGAQGPQGEAGFNSLINTIIETPGANCEFGGLKIESGLDLNRDGILNSNEVQATAFVCNGENGDIIETTIEPQGTNCEFGGVKADTGPDINLNGILDPNEIVNTFFVCNGVPGVSGPLGEQGFNSLINSTNEPTGINCEYGGLKIESGLDLNRDGSLNPGEVQDTSFLCKNEDSNCALAPPGIIYGNSALFELLCYLLIPTIIIIRRIIAIRR